MSVQNTEVVASQADFRLEVDRDELLSAIRSIASFKRRSSTGRLKLSFADGELQLSMPNVEIGMAAQGSWSGAVWIDAKIIWALAAVPPSGNPILVTFQKDRVRIGSTVAFATSRKP